MSRYQQTSITPLVGAPCAPTGDAGPTARHLAPERALQGYGARGKGDDRTPLGAGGTVHPASGSMSHFDQNGAQGECRSGYAVQGAGAA